MSVPVFDRQIGYEEVREGGATVPIHTIGNGNYELPVPGADLPGSRIPDANIRLTTHDYTTVIGEAIVRLDHPGYIVQAWSEGRDTMHSLRAAVRSLVEGEQRLRA